MKAKRYHALFENCRYSSLKKCEDAFGSAVLYVLPYLAPFPSDKPLSVFRNFLQYLIAFSSRRVGAYDAISGIFVGPFVLDKHVKFRDVA